MLTLIVASLLGLSNAQLPEIGCRAVFLDDYPSLAIDACFEAGDLPLGDGPFSTRWVCDEEEYAFTEVFTDSGDCSTDYNGLLSTDNNMTYATCSGPICEVASVKYYALDESCSGGEGDPWVIVPYIVNECVITGSSSSAMTVCDMTDGMSVMMYPTTDCSGDAIDSLTQVLFPTPYCNGDGANSEIISCSATPITTTTTPEPTGMEESGNSLSIIVSLCVGFGFSFLFY